MNKVTPLNKESVKSADTVSLGQIYSRVRPKDGQVRYYIVAKSDRGFYLICLEDGDRWSSCATNINEVFGLIGKWSDFTLVTDPIVLTPKSDSTN
jgi:hypothetical protein